MEKPGLPLEFAKTFLAASTCDTLVDYDFGDSEVFWKRNGRGVAIGYFGRTSSVYVNETRQFAATSFEDEEADELEDLGHNGKFERNDTVDR